MKNKILSYSTFGVILALIIAVIVISIIPVSLNVPLKSNGFKQVVAGSGINTPDGINIHFKNRVRFVSAYNDAEIYDEIIRLYKQASSYTLIGAMFSGMLDKQYVVERLASSKSVSSLYSSGALCLQFVYETEQVVYNSNGSEYEHETAGKPIYRTLYIPITSSNAVTNVEYYFPSYNKTTGTDESYAYYCYSVYVNLFDLYSYLTSDTSPIVN